MCRDLILNRRTLTFHSLKAWAWKLIWNHRRCLVRSRGVLVHALPAQLLAFVLFVEPFLQRSKVIEDGGCIHLTLSTDGFESVRPGFALAHAEHLVQALACGLALVNRATMQRTFLPSGLAQRAVELE